MSMGGNLGDYTQTDYMAAQAGGIKDWSGNIYTDPEVGWLSALGYDELSDNRLYCPQRTGRCPFRLRSLYGKRDSSKESER